MAVTAVDINILLDVVTAHSPFGAMTQRALEQCTRAGEKAFWIA